MGCGAVSGHNRLLRPDDIVITLGAPSDNAKVFCEHRSGKGQRLIRYRNTWYLWRGPDYRKLDKEAVDAEVGLFLENAVYAVPMKDEDGTKIGDERRAFKPVLRDVSEMVAALMRRPEIRVREEIKAPFWLPHADADQTTHRAEDILSCANGLLNVNTGELLPHSPYFLTMNSVPFSFDPDANCPLFDAFLDENQPGSRADFPTEEEYAALSSEMQDAQNWREAILEALFYMISGDTSQEKAFLFIGRKRAGKGTLAFILGKLIGEDNHVGFSLQSLDKEFGAETAI